MGSRRRADHLVVEGLANGWTDQQVADFAGVRPITVKRRRAEPAIRAQVRELAEQRRKDRDKEERELWESGRALTKGAMGKLVGVLNNPQAPPGAIVTAMAVLLRYFGPQSAPPAGEAQRHQKWETVGDMFGVPVEEQEGEAAQDIMSWFMGGAAAIEGASRVLPSRPHANHFPQEFEELPEEGFEEPPEQEFEEPPEEDRRAGWKPPEQVAHEEREYREQTQLPPAVPLAPKRQEPPASEPDVRRQVANAGEQEQLQEEHVQAVAAHRAKVEADQLRMEAMERAGLLPPPPPKQPWEMTGQDRLQAMRQGRR
jgi:hypothetical protein